MTMSCVVICRSHKGRGGTSALVVVVSSHLDRQQLILFRLLIGP